MVSPVIQRANETPIDPDLMKAILDFIAAMPSDQREDLTGRMLGIIRFLEDRLGRQDRGSIANILTSFQFRMEALIGIRNRKEYLAWSMQVQPEEKFELIHEALVEVAATHPLIERRRKPAFDSRNFFRIVLEKSKAEGQA